MSSERKSCGRAAKKIHDLGKILVKEELTAKYKQISDILKIPSEDRTDVQKEVLQFSPDIVKRCQANKKKRDQSKSRSEEVEDNPEVLEQKSIELAMAIHRSERLVVYTGAGISTAANIPDYRGPNGVWTLKEKGITVKTRDLCEAVPTYTHMALAHLMRTGKVKHIVSQNCDGLHLRSGVDRTKLSELHGNMFIEVCPNCAGDKEYVRLFDVTERTGVRKHATGRHCHCCQSELKDTIVHFGEKGSMRPPYRWQEARDAAESSDMILCLGTSLKVLKRYACLWCMDRPKKKRPLLYIVNLQWTPKDDVAQLKIQGNCDAIFQLVIRKLELQVPPYYRYRDPIFDLAVQLKRDEWLTTKRKILTRGELKLDHNYSLADKQEHACDEPADVKSTEVSRPGEKYLTDSEELSSPGWYGLGYKSRRIARKRTT